MAIFGSSRKRHYGKAPAAQKGTMYLRRVDNGRTARYELSSHSTEKVEWVSMEKDEMGRPLTVRKPLEVTTVHGKTQSFSVAGKRYPNFYTFLRHQDGEWGEDLYGRKVLCTKEKFPCFDSYDRIYETRYFRWYFIREGNSVSQVFATDERDMIYITEDVENVEGWAWMRMKSTGFCQPPKQEG